MKYELETKRCFKNDLTKYHKRTYDKRKARTIVNNVLRDYSDLPLAWDQLTGVELIGMVEVEPLEVDLYFGLQVVTITSVVVDDNLSICVAGTNYGKLVY